MQSDVLVGEKMSLKHLLAGLIVISASLVAATALTRAHAQTAAGMPQAARTPVVVELFTSEGCSSCPPADALLARLAQEPLAGNVQLIALEEHVDYWDNQGWVDPFSSHDWTSRQYDYAATLGNRNPYTPQMVVDGSAEFSGGHAQKAHDAILNSASKAKIPVILALGSSSGTNKENISVKVGKLEGTTKGDPAEVWLAITETGLHSAVTRGENAGEDLHHAAIVRSMRKIGEAKGEREASFAEDVTVPLKKEWKRENLRAVLFVQEKKSRRILGAAEIRIPG
jgi:hypothetical protein